MERVESYLDALEAELEELSRQYWECLWKLRTEGHSDGLEEAQKVWLERTRDLADHAQLTVLKEKDLTGILGRRALRLWQVFRDAPVLRKPEVKRLQTEVVKLQNEVAQTHANFRPTLRGKKASYLEIQRILREEEDRNLRRDAWFADQAFGAEVEDRARELVLRRNELAREMGYSDLYHRVLEGQEGVEEEFLANLLVQLESLTDGPHQRKVALLQDELGVVDIQYWDKSKEGQELTRRIAPLFPKDSHLPRLIATLRGIGIEWDDLSIFLDIDEREGKSPYAYAGPINVPLDVRLLANLGNGPYYCWVLFHEGGHCLHFALVQQPYWILREPESCFQEAMAEIIGGLIKTDVWRRRYADLPEELVAELREERWKEKIKQVRWYTQLLTFERELFTNPHQNLNDLWWGLGERLLGLSRPDGECSWANIIAFSTHPVYLQGFLIAELIRAHTYEYLRRTQGSIIDNPATGRFLIENYYRPGDSKPWGELIREATGEELNPQYFVDELLRDLPK